MSFPEPFAGRRRRCDPDQEGKRQVPLYLDNAAFSRLIKLGQKAGHTPARMAQALFDEAIEARGKGKSAVAQAAAAGDLADAIEDDLRQQLAEARARSEGRISGLLLDLSNLQADLAKMTAKHDEQLAGRERALDQVVETQDLLIAARNERDEARRERDALSSRCWNIERELDELRKPPVPVTVDPSEPGTVAAVEKMVAAVRDGAPILTPPAAEPIPEGYEPCDRDSGDISVNGQPMRRRPPAIGRGTIKAVLAMRSMGATAAEITKDLALLRPIVDQVLRENGA